MRVRSRNVETVRQARTPPCVGPSKLFCGKVHRHVIILSQENPARDGHFAHVNLGRRLMSDMETRGSVIVGVCQHDPGRWWEFDAIYRPILFAYLRKQGLEDFEADDVIGDIYVKLLRQIQTYDRTKCRFRTWLFTVAQNTLIDRARRRATYKKALGGWAAQVLKADPSDSIKMEAQWTRIHREKILAHALKVVRTQVSSKAWTCFQQRLLRNRPAAEISAKLKITPDAVYVNACRVMKQVREVCEEFDEDISHAFESDVSGRT
jgi:RNA polymerase sigma-70 factor, ECF subfamily